MADFKADKLEGRILEDQFMCEEHPNATGLTIILCLRHSILCKHNHTPCLPMHSCTSVCFPCSGSSLSRTHPGFTSGCGEDGGCCSGPLSHGFLLALHRAEEEGLHCHEALADEALGAASALEALWLGVPVELAVGNPLGLGLHRTLAGGAFLE